MSHEALPAPRTHSPGVPPSLAGLPRPSPQPGAALSAAITVSIRGLRGREYGGGGGRGGGIRVHLGPEDGGRRGPGGGSEEGW